MGFNEWWSFYPRKVSKLVAMKAYDQMKKKGYTDAELLAGIKRYIAELERLNTGLEFVPYPASWLRAGRWLDELNELATGGGSAGFCLEGAETKCTAPPDGYGSIIHRKLGDALFQAYFSGCEFKERFVIAPTAARRDYILNKFQYRLPDLDVRVQE